MISFRFCLFYYLFSLVFVSGMIQESKPWAIQLLSVACLSLAAKMEEQRVPPLSEYPIQGYCFENKVIKNMELLILSTLEWRMGLATPFAYLHYFVSKFFPGSRPETIITKATEHIVTMVRGNFLLAMQFSHQRTISKLYIKVIFFLCRC